MLQVEFINSSGTHKVYAAEILNFEWDHKGNEDAQFEASVPSVSASLQIFSVDSYLENLDRGSTATISETSGVGMTLELRVVDVRCQITKGLSLVSMSGYFYSEEVHKTGIQDAPSGWNSIKQRYGLQDIEFHGTAPAFSFAYEKRSDVPIAMIWSMASRHEIANTPFVTRNRALNYKSPGAGIFKATRNESSVDDYSPLYRVGPSQIVDYDISPSQPPVTHVRSSGIGRLAAFPDVVGIRTGGSDDVARFSIYDRGVTALYVAVRSGGSIVEQHLKWSDGKVSSVGGAAKVHVLGIFEDAYVVYKKESGSNNVYVYSKEDDSIIVSFQDCGYEPGPYASYGRGVTISLSETSAIAFFKDVGKASGQAAYKIAMVKSGNSYSFREDTDLHGDLVTAYSAEVQPYVTKVRAFYFDDYDNVAYNSIMATEYDDSNSTWRSAVYQVLKRLSVGSDEYDVYPADISQNEIGGYLQTPIVMYKGYGVGLTSDAMLIGSGTTVVRRVTGADAVAFTSREVSNPGFLYIVSDQWVETDYNGVVQRSGSVTDWISSTSLGDWQSTNYFGGAVYINFLQGSNAVTALFYGIPFETRDIAKGMYALKVSEGEANILDIDCKVGQVLQGLPTHLDREVGRIWIEIAGFDNCKGVSDWESLDAENIYVPAIGAYIEAHLTKEEEDAGTVTWIKITGVSIRYAGAVRMTIYGIVVA